MRELLGLAAYIGLGFAAMGVLAWLDGRRNR